jgi:UDP-glucuronate decarboxylase
MKTILVTGGAGFIGSHLCGELIDKGNRVICVDNFFSGREENISDLRGSDRFTLIKHDIVEPLAILESLDEVYNLACVASPVGYQSKPVETLMVCSVGIKNMLDLAIEKKAKFLQTSTSEVYGDPKEHPQRETYWGNVNPNGIRSCYDEGKRFAESLIFTYHRLYNLETKVVRIFNTYGPNMAPSDGRVISNFISKALSGKDIIIYGDGTQTRSFCYVTDMVAGLILMMESGQTGPINLGNSGEFTINELANIIKKITLSSSSLTHAERPADDPTLRRPDISLARNLLRWQPQIALEDGLRLSLPYFTQQIEK